MRIDKLERYQDSTDRRYVRLENGQHSFWQREIDGEMFTTANTLKQIFPNLTVKDLDSNGHDRVEGLRNARRSYNVMLYGARTIAALQAKYLIEMLDIENVLSQMAIRNDIAENVPSK